MMAWWSMAPRPIGRVADATEALFMSAAAEAALLGKSAHSLPYFLARQAEARLESLREEHHLPDTKAGWRELARLGWFLPHRKTKGAGRRQTSNSNRLMAFLPDFDTIRRRAGASDRATYKKLAGPKYARRWDHRSRGTMMGWLVDALDPNKNRHLRTTANAP
jgi:hypothetical protein